MRDAIGHPLEIGDYVTAVWANGNVALFEIVELRNAGTKYGRMKRRYDEIGLSRAFDSGDINEETKIKTVYKFPEQITWVDKNYVMLHMFER